MTRVDVQRLAREVERLGTLALPYADPHREITDRVRQAMRRRRLMNPQEDFRCAP